MTDKEFKWLSRPQLIDIIYQLQLKVEELTAENQQMQEALKDKRIRMEEAGNIAEAALGIHHVFQAAQSAAEQYMEEIRAMHEEAKVSCRNLLEEAQREAAAIVAQAQAKRDSRDSSAEMIPEDGVQNP